MLTLYQQQNSGNCYKARLILAHMRLRFRIVDINSLDGSTRAAGDMPHDAWTLAKTLEWLFFEQYSREPAIFV